MDLSKLIDGILQTLKENAPEILTGLAIAGVGTTAAVAARGGFQAGQRLTYEKPDMTVKEKFLATWPFYMPAVVTGAGTITCIVLASKGQAKRTAAAVTAYSMTERAFSEYRDKMVAEMGQRKDQKILDAMAQDQVHQNPPPMSGILVVGKDESLFCELHTGRYFKTDMESVRKAINDVNHWINIDRKVRLDDFYNLIGIPSTDTSDRLGWTDDELMELIFSTAMTEDERPCITFRYNYLAPLQ